MVDREVRAYVRRYRGVAPAGAASLNGVASVRCDAMRRLYARWPSICDGVDVPGTSRARVVFGIQTLEGRRESAQGRCRARAAAESLSSFSRKREDSFRPDAAGGMFAVLIV